jgi:hypothetical protein
LAVAISSSRTRTLLEKSRTRPNRAGFLSNQFDWHPSVIPLSNQQPKTANTPAPDNQCVIPALLVKHNVHPLSSIVHMGIAFPEGCSHLLSWEAALSQTQLNSLSTKQIDRKTKETVPVQVRVRSCYLSWVFW